MRSHIGQAARHSTQVSRDVGCLLVPAKGVNEAEGPDTSTPNNDMMERRHYFENRAILASLEDTRAVITREVRTRKMRVCTCAGR